MTEDCEWCDGPIAVKAPSAPGRQRTRFCSDNCRKRSWENMARATCPACGELMGAGTAWASKSTRLCLECERAERSASHDANVQKVARLYNAGMSIKEIGRELGYGENSVPGMLVQEARRRGLLDSYRYDETRRENMRAGRAAARQIKAE